MPECSKMPSYDRELKRIAMGLALYGHFDHRLRAELFDPYSGLCVAFDYLQIFRRSGDLCSGDDSDGGVWHVLAAKWNAAFIASHMERIGGGWDMHHELTVECVDRVTLWDEAHAEHIVSKLVAEHDRQERIQSLRMQIERLQEVSR